MDCLFCKIIKKEMDSYVLYEDDDVIAILDAYPDATGHTLIIPKKHCEDIMSIDGQTFTKVFEIAKKISVLLEDKLNTTGSKFIINYKEPQFIKHFHLHVIPTYKKDTKMEKEEVYRILKGSIN